VRDGNVITAGGVASDIDVGLGRVAEIAGATVARAILLDIEYDPDPPFDAGHPDRAPDDVKALLSSRYEKANTAFRAGIEQSTRTVSWLRGGRQGGFNAL
jgi:cyclohexyl-isocyanide hydratase